MYRIKYSMSKIEDLEQRIAKIEQRNKKVETDKSWEISWTRRFFIAFFTYLSIAIYLNVIGVSDPLLNAIVPTIGFLLSTLTFPLIKKVWIKYFHK